MEGRDNLNELLVSFLLDELNEKDKKSVEDWLRSDEQNKVYLEELRQILNLVDIKQSTDKIDVNSEWMRFEQFRQQKDQKAVFTNPAEQFGNEVIREVELKRKGNVYRIIAYAAMAACVVLSVGLGWSIINRDNDVKQAVANAKANAEDERKNVPAIKQWVNSSSESKEYHLEDGTIVVLHANSDIRFREPFDVDRREVQLTGKAEFNVAKDQLRPFTVYTDNISTRAVGTRFVVTSYKNENQITVRLFEGKVLVKASPGGEHENKKGYCLSPGEELVYNKTDQHTRLWAYNARGVRRAIARKAKVRHSIHENPGIPKYGKGSWYMFNNEPLSQVFNELADMYNVEIVYSKKDIDKIYFIGTFNKSDSLEGVLRQITQINNLRLIRTDNKYTIKKK